MLRGPYMGMKCEKAKACPGSHLPGVDRLAILSSDGGAFGERNTLADNEAQAWPERAFASRKAEHASPVTPAVG